MSDKNKNNLEFARKRIGLSQKQISALLGFKRTKQLSQYETGAKLPSLVIAFKLQTIFNSPLHFLFSDLYKRYSDEIEDKSKILNLENRLLPGKTNSIEYCLILEMLKTKERLSYEALRKADKHTIQMMRLRTAKTENQHRK